jgi:hypothetical protein
MADLNALIAQGAQFAAPVDPFAQYGKMQQLEQASSTNQLNRMKMDEYQRGLQEQNALRGLDPAAADYLTQIKKVNPKLGFEFGKLMQEGENLKLTGLKTQADVAKAKKEMLGSSLRDMASNPSDENIIAHTQDYALNPLFKDDLPSIQANAKRLLAMTPDQRKAVLSGTGATAADLKPPAPTNIANLIRERNALPQGDPNRKLYDQQINDLGAATRNAQQRLAFDQAKFEWEKKNPTKSIQDDGTGLVAVDTKTGIATPVVYGASGIQTAPAAPSVTVDGRSFPGLRTDAPASRAGTQVPGKPKAIPEAYAKQAMGVLNTNDALQTLQDVTQKFTAADMVDPVKRAQIGQAHATTLLFAKEMFNLGVLNGGDERIVNSVINNPIDFSSSIIPIEAIRKQARDLQDVVQRTNKNLSTVYKLPPQELKRTSPASGVSSDRSAADRILGGQ